MDAAVSDRYVHTQAALTDRWAELFVIPTAGDTMSTP